MDRPELIQLSTLEHSIDASRAAHLLCPPGVVLVEMLPAPPSLRGLLLPDRVSADCRPDVGIVLACGFDVSLSPGQMVAVRGYDGQWIEGFDAPGYSTANQVRVYGKATPFEGEIHRADWSESIPLILLPESDEMVATKNNLIVRREPEVCMENGIELPSAACYRTGLAEVISVGPEADLRLETSKVVPGDRIHYDTRGELAFAFGGDPDLAIIPDVAVNFVIR